MSFVASIFKKPKAPTITVVKPKPTETPLPTTQKEVSEIKQEEKKKLKKGRKRRGTILTSPRGILTQPPVAIKTLLGE